jgi:hypothetical protein
VEVEIAFATDELVRRLEGAIDAFAVAWLEGHASGDNPAGILLERFGGVVAAAAPGRPDLDFMNRIHGLAFANPAVLVEVLSFYGSLGLRPWIELPPGAEEVAAHLAEAGARPVESLAVLFGTAYVRPSPPSIEVRRIGRTAIRGSLARGPRRSFRWACGGRSRNRGGRVAGRHRLLRGGGRR